MSDVTSDQILHHQPIHFVAGAPPLTGCSVRGVRNDRGFIIIHILFVAFEAKTHESIMGAGESKGASAMAIMPYKDALARFDAVEVSMIEDAVNKFGDGAGGVDRNTFIRCCLTVLPDKIQHVSAHLPLSPSCPF